MKSTCDVKFWCLFNYLEHSWLHIAVEELEKKLPTPLGKNYNTFFYTFLLVVKSNTRNPH